MHDARVASCESSRDDSHQETRSSARQCRTSSLSMKIFFLQNCRTRSPRHALSISSARQLRITHASIDRYAIHKSTLVEANPAILVSTDTRFLRIRARESRSRVDRRDARALVSSRQRFLKGPPVFFHMLVYSECRAFRFPNARSD